MLQSFRLRRASQLRGTEPVLKADRRTGAFGFETLLRNTILKQDVVDWDKIRDEEFPEFRKEAPEEFHGTFATAVFLSLPDPGDFAHLRQFVKHVGLENLGQAHIIKYMRACEDPEEILRCWRFLSAREPVFTYKQVVDVVAGLLKTSDWRQGEKLLRDHGSTLPRDLLPLMMKKLCDDRRSDEGLAWLSSTAEPRCIDDFSNVFMEDRERAEKFLDHMTAVGARMSEKFDPTRSKQWSEHFDVRAARIAGRMCSSCRKPLPDGKLSPEEFRALRDAAIDKVLKRGDIYRGSHPRELAAFKKFMVKRGPFDAVIDGPNVFYKSDKPALLCKSVGKKYHELGHRRILIVTKAHLLEFFRKIHLPPGVRFYSSADQSEDDPFLIIAALMSHPDCRMLSSDLWRDHKVLLKQQRLAGPSPGVSELFDRWVFTRRDLFREKYDKYDIRQTVQFAPGYFPIPFADPQGWHVPTSYAPGGQPKWFCIRRRTTVQ